MNMFLVLLFPSWKVTLLKTIVIVTKIILFNTVHET